MSVGECFRDTFGHAHTYSHTRCILGHMASRLPPQGPLNRSLDKSHSVACLLNKHTVSKEPQI